MKVFITGSNGFVGLNIVKALTEAGHDVIAYVRPNSNLSHLSKFNVRLAYGELHDQAKLNESMSGVDAVVHTAGNTSCHPKDIPVLRNVNVDGTRRVVNAAVTNKVKRFVFTSTTSTIGAKNSAGDMADETRPLTGFRASNPYGLSKLEAEAIVLGAIARGIEPIVLNLAEVIGAYDYNMQWGRLVLAVHYNQVPFNPPGGASFCSAAKVGQAHVSALANGRPGERYILAGPGVQFAEFVDRIARLLGTGFDRPKSNYWALYVKALLQQKYPKLVPGTPLVEPYRMRVFGGQYYFSSEKAMRELGYELRPLDDTLGQCIEWYRNNGFLKAPAAAAAAQKAGETSKVVCSA
jgi:dihydroflavonol-4-reductase